MPARPLRPRRTPPAVRVRLLSRDDPAVDAVFAALSPRSRYLRFHTPMPRLASGVRRGLLDVDGLRHAGLVAEMRTWRGPVAVGVARLVGSGGASAELAVEVADRWQGRGVGRQLLEALGEHAQELGYRELHGDVLPDNQRVVRLLRRVFPGSRVSRSGAVTRVSCPLGWSAESLTHEDLLTDLLG